MKVILLPATQPGLLDSEFSHVVLCVTEESVALVKEARQTVAEFFQKHAGAWGCLTVRGPLDGIALERPLDDWEQLFEAADAAEGGLELTRFEFDRFAAAGGVRSLECAGFAVSADSVDFCGYGKHGEVAIEGRTSLERHFFGAAG